MPKLRRDPTTDEWVIFATERARRPDDFAVRDSGADEKTPACPFCPGNEAATPPAVLTLPGGNKLSWSVRVVPNKFAALTPGVSGGPSEVGSMYREMEGIGRHEVIVETPEHDTSLGLLQEAQVFDVLRAYQL